MTDREKAIVMAYTGVCTLKGDKFNIFHQYIEELMGRPVYTHEMGFLEYEIKEKAKEDFVKLCEAEEFCQVMKDTVKESKKQHNQRPVIYESDGDADGFPVYDMARCPNCDTLIMDDEANWGEPYCMKCGQALKWEV